MWRTRPWRATRFSRTPSTDAGGKYRFRLKASNGEIVAASQAYADKASCLKGIRSIGSHAPDAEIVVIEPEE